MRKGLAIALILILTLSLAGCKAAATAEAAATSSATPAALPGRQTNNVMSLIMGTLQLDGTENAVDAAQAAELLPLWKAYRALLKSDATAPAELTALVEQIRDSMTPEQILAMEGATLGPEEQSRSLLASALRCRPLAEAPAHWRRAN